MRTLLLLLVGFLSILGCGTGASSSSVSITLLGFEPQVESVPRKIGRFSFHNTGTGTCNLGSYQVRWEGGEQSVPVEPPVAIAAGDTIERTVELNYRGTDDPRGVVVDARCD